VPVVTAAGSIANGSPKLIGGLLASTMGAKANAGNILVSIVDAVNALTLAKMNGAATAGNNVLTSIVDKIT
jgi:hypothetical protein